MKCPDCGNELLTFAEFSVRLLEIVEQHVTDTRREAPPVSQTVQLHEHEWLTEFVRYLLVKHRIAPDDIQAIAEDIVVALLNATPTGDEVH